LTCRRTKTVLVLTTKLLYTLASKKGIQN
jgi:hypothetical protein